MSTEVDYFSYNFVKQQAEFGDLFYQGYLGYLYDTGKKGAPKDFKEAIKWFSIASDRGSDYATTYLGYMYEKGRGVKEDQIQAFKFYKIAADKGYNLAKCYLGNRYEIRIGDFVEAERLYKECCDDVAIANFFLGHLYERGGGGQGRDDGETNFKEFLTIKKPRKKEMYLHQNIKLAVQYFEKFVKHEKRDEDIENFLISANEGYPEEQIVMGLLYLKGLGVKQDHVEAYKWFALAAEKDENAKKYLDDLIEPSFESRCIHGRLPLHANDIKKGNKLIQEWKNGKLKDLFTK